MPLVGAMEQRIEATYTVCASRKESPAESGLCVSSRYTYHAMSNQELAWSPYNEIQTYEALCIVL